MIIYSSVRNAGVAQLVEQLICNQQVGGSSPSTSSKLPLQRTGEYGGIPEWPKGADCKSVVSDFGGSNPPSPTKKSDILWIPDFFAPFCYICFSWKVRFTLQSVARSRSESFRLPVLTICIIRGQQPL